MTDNRTTELRAKLTERGLECKPTKFSTLQTTFTANGVEWIVTENESTGELFVEPRHGLTPEQAIAATLGNDASAVRLADRLRGIADEMRSVGASSMTPQELLACYASDVNKVADSLMFAATLGSGTCHDQAAPSAKRFCCSMCCTTDAQKNPLFCHGCGRKVEQ